MSQKALEQVSCWRRRRHLLFVKESDFLLGRVHVDVKMRGRKLQRQVYEGMRSLGQVGGIDLLEASAHLHTDTSPIRPRWEGGTTSRKLRQTCAPGLSVCVGKGTDARNACASTVWDKAPST